MENAGRLKISGKFPALKVELDGKLLPTQEIVLRLDAKDFPMAYIAFPVFEEIDIDIPALIEVPKDED